MLNAVYSDCEKRMKKAVEVLKDEYKTIRAGRATPSLLDKITVEYYGSQVPLKQVSNISAPEARLLVIQPWDKSVISAVEKAIMTSDLGLTPNTDGSIIRLNIPHLTEERRIQLNKLVSQKAEDTKVAVRNVRRDANDEVKLLENESEISEENAKRAYDNIQEMTDEYIKKVDEVLKAKQEEIMEV
jgi:ribosome recycling factor